MGRGGLSVGFPVVSFAASLAAAAAIPNAETEPCHVRTHFSNCPK